MFWIGAGVVGLLGAGYYFAEPQDVVPAELNWLSSYGDGVRAAKKNNKPILLNFTSDWCGGCRDMKTRMADKRFLSTWNKVNLVRVNVNDPYQRKVMDKFFPGGSIPHTIVVRPDGSQLGQRTGFGGPVQFSRFVEGCVRRY